MRVFLPLNALRVFDVAARTGSYAEAATELGLTHGAVSRQIAVLEDWLGQRLFVRVGRRMAATPIARVFASEVRLSFDRMIAAADACGRPGMRRTLRVNAPTSFAMRWLIPRLERFRQAKAEIEVVVTTVSTAHEELRGGFDVAIRRGSAANGAWPRDRATQVLEDVDTLIMSPALFARQPIRSPADVEGHALLTTETRPGDWIDWLDAAGLPHLASRRRQVFDHFFITQRAIEDGLGIGIGPLPLLQTDIDVGKLMTPLPQIRVPRTGYVALVSTDTDPTGPAAAFVAWLAAEQSQA